MYAHTHAYTRTCTHWYVGTQTCTHIHTYIHTYMYIHKHAHNRTHTYIQTCTHSHSYTCSHVYNICSVQTFSSSGTSDRFHEQAVGFLNKKITFCYSTVNLNPKLQTLTFLSRSSMGQLILELGNIAVQFLNWTKFLIGTEHRHAFTVTCTHISPYTYMKHTLTSLERLQLKKLVQ